MHRQSQTNTCSTHRDTYKHTYRHTDINTHIHRDPNIDTHHPQVHNCPLESNQVSDQGPERVQRVLGTWRRAASLCCVVGTMD